MKIISKSSEQFLPPKVALTDEEIRYKLDLQQPTHQSSGNFLSLTKINSTFIEIIDTGHQWVGLWSAIGVPGFIFPYWMIKILLKMGLSSLLLFSPIVIFIALMSGFLAWMDFHKWTCYPTRICRKTKSIYHFRIDGTVLCAPWDEIHFSLCFNGKRALSAINLRACVMDEKREMVLESFDFGTQCESEEGALRQWEFLRQYMLNGPKDLIGSVRYCMPSGKRESYFTGLERISAQYPGVFFKILLFPFSLYVSIFRFLAMRTHRIPVWPKEVEDACAIESGDPYVKDYRSNPKDLQ